MIKKISTIILLFGSVFSCAQDKRGYTVIFGGGGNYARFDGSQNMPQTKQLYPNPVNSTQYRYFDNESSNISDSASGSLLFLCSSMVLYDTLGNVIDNGDSLQPNKIYAHNCCPATGQATQGSLILPKGSNNQYYVFTPTMSDSLYTVNVTGQQSKAPFDILQYHVVDMNANGGLGKVVQKNVKLLENIELCKTGMMACRHANGYDWWLLKQGASTNTIYTFLVTKDTVVLDTVQSFSAPVFGYYDLAGQSCFNSDGSKYAFASGGGFTNTNGAQLCLFDFDRCYGVLSSPKIISVPYDSCRCIYDTLWGASWDSLITGISFSPNDSLLYISRRFTIYQYDLYEPNTSQAFNLIKQGADTSFTWFEEYGQLYLGIDNRIYIGKIGASSGSNSFIDKPNNKGSACDFCRKCIRVDTTWYYTQSFANMPNFNMPKKEPCWPLGLPNPPKEGMEEIVVYPNPSSGMFYIKNKKGKKKELFNIIGELVLSTFKDELDVSYLSRGVYYIKCEGVSKKVIVE